MGIIRTVCGDIDSSELGFTMAHEHLFMQKGRNDGPETDLSLWRWDKAMEMMQEYKAAGGGAIVEATPRYWDGRDPAGMQAVSKATGVHVIACSGAALPGQWNDFDKEFANVTVEELAERFAKEITEGMDGTDIKAGWLKGTSMYNYITKGAEKALRACAQGSKLTGCAVHTHTATGTFAIEQTEIVDSEGMDMRHFGVAHIDRNPDFWVLKKIAEKGCYLIYDGPGKAKYYPDSMRIELLKKMFDAGYGKQIMLSNDMGRKSHHKVYGAGPGWTWIKERFCPRLLEEGFTQAEVDDLTINNPARFYSLW